MIDKLTAKSTFGKYSAFKFYYKKVNFPDQGHHLPRLLTCSQQLLIIIIHFR
jgi:hypothetical protein